MSQATPPDPDLRPGDETSSESPGAAENICPTCGGSGRDDAGAQCQTCAGTGRVTEGVGGG